MVQKMTCVTFVLCPIITNFGWVSNLFVILWPLQYYSFFISFLNYFIYLKRKRETQRVLRTLIISMLWRHFHPFDYNLFNLFICNDVGFFLLMMLYSYRNTYMSISNWGVNYFGNILLIAPNFWCDDPHTVCS